MSAAFTWARLGGVVAGGGGLLVASLAVGLGAGERPLDVGAALQPGSVEATIFFGLRLPRVALAALVGAALSSSGAVLQTLLRNPLADPFLLGVSGGAALGATVALALGLPPLWWGLSAVTALALGGAVGATALVLLVGQAAGGPRLEGTLLAGVIFNAFALGAIVFVKALVAPDRLGDVLYFLAGSLGQESPLTLGVAAALVGLCLAVTLALAPRLNLLAFGEDDAATLGVEVGTLRVALLLTVSLAVAVAVALSGLIGFVGLVVPHLARLVTGADSRLHLPASALGGAAFLVLADAGTRALFVTFQAEPPVGVLTALLGGPLFLALLARRGRTAG